MARRRRASSPAKVTHSASSTASEATSPAGSTSTRTPAGPVPRVRREMARRAGPPPEHGSAAGDLPAAAQRRTRPGWAHSLGGCLLGSEEEDGTERKVQRTWSPECSSSTGGASSRQGQSGNCPSALPRQGRFPPRVARLNQTTASTVQTATPTKLRQSADTTTKATDTHPRSHAVRGEPNGALFTVVAAQTLSLATAATGCRCEGICQARS